MGPSPSVGTRAICLPPSLFALNYKAGGSFLQLGRWEDGAGITVLADSRAAAPGRVPAAPGESSLPCETHGVLQRQQSPLPWLCTLRGAICAGPRPKAPCGRREGSQGWGFSSAPAADALTAALIAVPHHRAPFPPHLSSRVPTLWKPNLPNKS